MLFRAIVCILCILFTSCTQTTQAGTKYIKLILSVKIVHLLTMINTQHGFREDLCNSVISLHIVNIQNYVLKVKQIVVSDRFHKVYLDREHCPLFQFLNERCHSKIGMHLKLKLPLFRFTRAVVNLIFLSLSDRVNFSASEKLTCKGHFYSKPKLWSFDAYFRIKVTRAHKIE